MSAVLDPSVLSQPIANQVEPEEPAYIRPGTIEKLTDPSEIYKFVNRTARLSDEDFDSVTHDLGYRVASWWFRAGALSGNVKLVTACEKYLNRVDAWRARRSIAKASVAGSAASGFDRPAPLTISATTNESDQKANETSEQANE